MFSWWESAVSPALRQTGNALSAGRGIKGTERVAALFPYIVHFLFLIIILKQPGNV